MTEMIEELDTMRRHFFTSKFIAMTGAHNLLFDNSGFYIEMTLPGGEWRRARLTYNDGLDLYEWWFYNYSGMTITKEKKYEMVYNDMVIDIFESETGLKTKL